MTSTWSQDLYIKAYRFAADAHNGQIFPGTELPYIMHISFVAMEVIAALENDHGLDGNLAVQCALLHDTLEDTCTTYDQLVEKFGVRGADGVKALTKDESVGTELSKQKQKKLQMADSLERIRKQPREIWMVKMADRITNLQPPPKHWSKDKINRYRHEASEIHRLLKGGSPYISARLHEKVDHYPR